MYYNGGYSPAMEPSYSTGSNDSTQTTGSYSSLPSQYSTSYPVVTDNNIDTTQMSFDQCYDFDSYGQAYDLPDWNDLNPMECTDFMQSSSPTDPRTAFPYDMGPSLNQTHDLNTLSRSPPSGLEALESERRTKPLECSCGRSFTRSADLKRHQTTVHYPVFQNCPVPKCARKGKNGFPRKDHLNEHLRSYHRINIAKREVPKKKPAKEESLSPNAVRR
ncbi:hypothetical protein DTO063F5_836 [Paecilomyces variotii]|nr:hypothetical protein DTO063F5_836 [Paecilomyces variotii]